MIEDEGIDRTVSNFVLNYIPLTPSRPQMSEWPLGFMTKRCKDDFELRKLGQIEESDYFTDGELDVSGRLFKWVSEIDDSVRKAIDKEKWIMEENLSKSRHSRPTFYPPLVIRSKSGYGKSILFGKILAELIDAKFAPEAKSEWPLYSRIVYSQLKDQTAISLEEAICQGMDGFHREKNLKEFFKNTNHIDSGEKILFIDSLDEHPKAQDWWDISLKLSDHGWRVVWACRDPDWNYLDLGTGKEGFYEPSDKNRKLHWNRFTGLEWDLDIPPEREQQLKDYSKVDWEKDKQKNKKFLDYAYSTTQLMHMFHTNLRLYDEDREALDALLIQNLIKSRNNVVARNGALRSNKKILNKFDDPDWYNEFFDSNLAKIIVDTSIEYISKLEENVSKQALESSWELICKRYFEEHHDKRQTGQLDERIIELETNDVTRLITNNTITTIQAVKQKEVSEILLDYLHAFGILRESDGEKKFRHRDFAVIAYVQGSTNGLEVLDKRDTIFSYFFPHPKHHDNSSQSENETDRIEDFLRRTGNVTSQINALWNLEELPLDINKIAEISITRFLMKNREQLPENKGISTKQRAAIELRQDRSAIVLHGVPGSGKTFSGVERILYRQATQYRKGSKYSIALVVSLNDELAKSIKEELNGQHKNSPFLESFTQLEKDEIINSIDVKSIKQILEEWMPSMDYKTNPDWLISHEFLREMFEKLRKRPGVSLDNWMFRLFQEDYQNNMFDLYTGEFLNVKDYINQSAVNRYIKDQKIITQWHEIVKNTRKKGKLPLQEACAILRNQLLDYESQKSYTNQKINSNYQTELGVIRFDRQASFALFQEKFQNGFYDCIMIDEVQDLPVISVNMLSFLSPSREPNRFILSGDKYQTLNGQNFDWHRYLTNLTQISDRIMEDHSDFVYRSVHHLRGLQWSNQEIKYVIDTRLDENFRNHPDISEFAMYSWKNWPSKGYFDESNNKEKYPFEEMKSRFKRVDKSEFTPILVIDSNNGGDFLEKLKIVLRSISARSGVSLLCSNQNLRQYVRQKLMGGKDGRNLAVETFDPWTIKGLERNAVVVLGGFSASPKGEDTQEIYDIDFSKKKEYHDFSGLERRVVDLIRRKMLVSHTRAVEQLIILNTPLNEKIPLGGQETSIKSINNMDYSKISEICKLEQVKQVDTLDEKLTEFFKASKIKDKHISIKRISEGLKLKNRTGSAVKQEYKNYLQSLRNILISDVHTSEVRRLLSALTENPSPEKSLDAGLTRDLMLIDTDERSFYSKPKPMLPLEKHDNDYSKMVDGVLSLLDSDEGCWSSEGFEVLKLVMSSYQVILANLGSLRKEFAMEYEDTEYASMLDDINRVLVAIEALIYEFSERYNLPSSTYNLSNYLLPYLISAENRLQFGSYPENGIQDQNFLNQFIHNLQGKLFEPNPRGDITLIYGDGNELILVGEAWINLIKDLIKTSEEQQGEHKLSFLEFSSKLTQLYMDIRKMADEELIKPNDKNQKLINEGTALSISNILNIGQKDEIDRFRTHIFRFIKEEFPGMEEPSEIAKLLSNIKDLQKEWLNDYIPDSVVLAWNLQNFLTFVDLLRSMTGQNRFTRRAIQLFNSSPHVTNWLYGVISTQKPMHKATHRLLDLPELPVVKGKPNLPDLKFKQPYFDIMKRFVNDISVTLNQSSDLNQHQIENLANVVVLSEFIRTTGQDLNLIYENKMKLFKSSFNNEEEWKIGEIFENFITEFSDSNKQMNERIEDVLNKLRGKKLDQLKSDVLLQISDLLETLELNPAFLDGKYGKDLIAKSFFLKGLGQVHHTNMNEHLQMYPSLQKLNLFDLRKVTEQPQYFMPEFEDATSEVEWSNSNEKTFFFPMQKDPLSQLIITGNVLENFELEYRLNEICSNLYSPDFKPEHASNKLFWSNDGFGKNVGYEDWLERNIEFQQFLQSAKKSNSTSLVLNTNFDLDSRLSKYLNVIDSIRRVLEGRLKVNKKPETTAPKELIRDVLLDLFNLKERAKKEDSGGGNVEFTIGVYSVGKLTIDVAQTGKISDTKVGDFLKEHDFVRLVFDLIAFSGNGRPNIEASLEALEYHTELFNQYLDRHKKEIGEVLEKKGLQDNFIVDDTMYEVLQGTPNTETSPKDEGDGIEEFDIDDTIEDFDDNQDDDTQESLVFDLTIGDEIEEDDVEDLNEMIFDLTIGDDEHQDDDIQENLVFDLTLVDDDLVKNRFNISNEEWEQLPENKKEEFRDSYVYLN